MRRVMIVLAVVMGCREIALSQTIKTIAGNGTPADCGDNGVATQACLFLPEGMVVDGSRNLYIADTGNNKIRRVEACTGIITTVVGNGVRTGFIDGEGGDPRDDLGNDGAATSATLNSPTDVKRDATGNLFIADVNNHCIRRVDSSGTITAYAGVCGSAGFSGDNGPALSAMLNGPDSIWPAADGTLYIADSRNHCIRKVDTQGTITTYAGTCTVPGYDSTHLNGPGGRGGLVGDSAGSLYFTDTLNFCIRKIDASGSQITTYAGICTQPGDSGDCGPATSATLGGPGPNRSIRGIALDRDGNLFIADDIMARVRKVASNGIITTYAGTGDHGFSGDNGPAANAKLNRPTGLAVDADGRLFISDISSIRVRRVTPQPPLFNKQIACAGVHWISLPTDSDLETAEELCAAVPHAVRVTQRFPTNPSPNPNPAPYIWDCINKICSSPTGGPEHFGRCCGGCFCLDDGEGFEVETSGAGIFMVNGRDRVVPITLPSGGAEYVVSPPISSTAVTAQDLFAIMGAPSLTTTLTDWDSCPMLFNTVTAGTAAAASLNLIPGKAVRLRFPDDSGLSYSNPAKPVVSPVCGTATAQRYCIQGTSTNQQYSWCLDLNNQNGCDFGDAANPSAGPVPPVGAPAKDLAADFATSIHDLGFPLVDAVAAGDCFVVSAPSPFSLLVGPSLIPAQPPTCKVTIVGCSYNPVITLVPAAAVSVVPTLDGWGLVALILILASSGAVVISRHRFHRKDMG